MLALAFGLAEGEERRVMAERLWALIKENGVHLNTGFTATPFILFALADNDLVDEAYELLLQDSRPSWLYAVRQGATTIWERWDSLCEDGSTWAACEHKCPYGRIKARWETESGAFRLALTVPVGTICELTLPNGVQHSLGSGEYSFTVAMQTE